VSQHSTSAGTGNELQLPALQSTRPHKVHSCAMGAQADSQHVQVVDGVHSANDD
jgi:hypothetical protein